jgi:hypothetical protein
VAEIAARFYGIIVIAARRRPYACAAPPAGVRSTPLKLTMLHLLAAVSAAAVPCAPDQPGGVAAVSAGLASALTKPRPTGPTAAAASSSSGGSSTGGGSASLAVYSGRNEVESFLIIVNGGARGIDGVQVDVPLPMPGAAVMLHAAHYHMCEKPSGCSGARGLWPDALVPDVDLHVRQKRNAFPLAVPARQNRIVWIDLFVPATATAGTTTHTVLVSSGYGDSSSLVASLQLNLTVLNFTLPTRPTLAGMFGHGADWSMVEREHNGSSDAETARLVKNYITAGLMNKVSFSDFLGGGDAKMLAGAGGNGTFQTFVDDYGGFIEGSVDLPFGPSPIALSSIQAPHHICSLSYNKHTAEVSNCTSEEARDQTEYWRNLTERFSAKGWAHLLYDYTVDEPSCHASEHRGAGSHTGGPIWDVLKARAAMVRKADPRLRTLVTTTAEAARNESALDLIDIFVPIINDLFPKARKSTGSGKTCSTTCAGESIVGNQRSTYDFVKPGNLWTYQSCMSYGCGPNSTCARINASGCELGWPSYAIDHNGVRNRAMEWASYLENVSGELYYSVTENSKIRGGQDCWDTANFYGGNGDGYMLYAGTPERIGGTRGIPVESMRLKHVRDGYLPRRLTPCYVPIFV